MKKIVLSAIAAIVVTVGMYILVLMVGISEHVATTTTAAAAFTATAFAAAAYFIALAVAFAAEQEGVRFQRVIVVYALEALAIWGALVVGNVVWSIAIALAGILALLVLWRFAPEPSVSVEEHATTA